MKKKFLAMYALVGAMVASPVFTSCVDDSVSPSVEAIRNAKAEQLKAMAELDKAEAAYKLAQAALENAEAEYKANQTAEAKAEFVYKIESIKAQYEASVMQYKASKVQWENSLKSNENTTITTAVNKYTGALDAVNELNEDLFIAKANLAQVGVDSAKNVALLNEYVAGQNAKIAKATADIERIKAYEGETKTSLDEKKAAVVANYKKLSNEKALADDALTKAKKAHNDAKTAFQKTAYREAKDELKTTYNINVTPEQSDLIVTPQNTTGFNINVAFTFSEADIIYQKKSLNDKLAAAKTDLGAPKSGDTPASGAYATLATYEAALKTAQDALAALAADATASAKEAAEDAVERAEIALAYYKEDMHDGQTNMLDADEDGFQDTDADGNLLYEPMGFAYAQKEVADAEKNIADFEALLAIVAEGSDAQKEDAAAVEAYLAAVESWIAANDKCTEINEAIEATGISSITVNSDNTETVAPATSGEYVVLNALWAEKDSATMIAELEADIAEAKANIETKSLANYVEEYVATKHWTETIDGTTYHYSMEVPAYRVIEVASIEIVKAIYEAEIAEIEAKLAVQKQLLAKYEAELQALLATEEEA